MTKDEIELLAKEKATLLAVESYLSAIKDMKGIIDEALDKTILFYTKKIASLESDKKS